MPANTPSSPDSRCFDLDVDGVRLRARKLASPGAPARPTLVFLHDSLGCINTWRDFPDRLARELGCGALIYDRRGYGGSDPFPTSPRTTRYLHDEAAVLARLLETCEIDDAVLYGHSDGATIALLAAALHPRAIRAVIAEGAHAFIEEKALVGLRESREVLRTTDLLARLARHHGEKAEAVAAVWIDTWLSPTFRSWNIESELEAISCPVVVLQGERDEYATEAQVRAILDGVGGKASSWLFPDLGHVPHKQAPDETIRVAARLLRELVGA